MSASMKLVNPEDVQVGMYVDLGNDWMNHDFLRSSFLVKTEKQRDKLRASKIRIQVCPKRSKVAIPEEPEDPPTESSPPAQTQAEPSKLHAQPAEVVPELEQSWAEKNKPAQKLADALELDVEPQQKAKVLFQHSTELMDDLLAKDPSVENIKQGSEALKGLAEFVVGDDEVSNRLLAITSHDYYTYTHSVNVGLKSLLIAKKILNTNDTLLLKELGVGFFLHDIGKSQVDPGILNKPGKLTAEEYEIMKTHPQRGVQLLREADSLTETARIITEQHHEKVDGTGYPYKLKGKQVHEFGQICALGDIYDALTSERSYKKGMSPFEALSTMKIRMSGHFDADLFEGFIRLFIDESIRAASPE